MFAECSSTVLKAEAEYQEAYESIQDLSDSENPDLGAEEHGDPKEDSSYISNSDYSDSEDQDNDDQDF